MLSRLGDLVRGFFEKITKLIDSVSGMLGDRFNCFLDVFKFIFDLFFASVDLFFAGRKSSAISGVGASCFSCSSCYVGNDVEAGVSGFFERFLGFTEELSET